MNDRRVVSLWQHTPLDTRRLQQCNIICIFLPFLPIIACDVHMPFNMASQSFHRLPYARPGNMTSLVMAQKFSHKFSHKFWIHRFPYSSNTLLMCVWPYSALRASLISTVFENSNPNKYSTKYQQNVLYCLKSVKSCPHGKRVNVAHTVILTRLQFWCHCAKLEVILSSTTIGKNFEIYFFWNVQFLTSLSNNWMGTKEKSLKNVWDFTGRAQGVGLIGWINTKPLVCLASSARSANAPGRAQSFLFGEFFQK